MLNCKPTPRNTGKGDLAMEIKSLHFKVRPMPSITTDNKGTIAVLNPANNHGK